MSPVHAFRLMPGDDLKKQIDDFVKRKKIEAGWIACAVGSLTAYHIRFANQQEGSRASGHFEILSLNGTVSLHGLHVHIILADSSGQTCGGHLLDENIIYTTAEIIIQEITDLIFLREKDGTTSWQELQVKWKNM
ncbi:MAG: PPC domain-containing DNA-binding protein [Flavisolibacter sp.]